jgi:deoxyadenosine/deoxycytidine kinase
MTFLKHRAEREMSIIQNSDPTPSCYILDRGILEDRHIFGQNQISQGFMSEPEIHQYTSAFNDYVQLIDKPDIVIFLRADVDKLLQRIQGRGRDMETGIDYDYLASLQSLYDKLVLETIEKSDWPTKVLKYDTNGSQEKEVFERVIGDLKRVYPGLELN